jgi:hypothetical protein
MVENVEPPTPRENRAINIPGKLREIAQKSWLATYRMPVVTNTGYRPLISEKGARTMGAMANPVVNVVIPT